jgi:hypothetical protein
MRESFVHLIDQVPFGHNITLTTTKDFYLLAKSNRRSTGRRLFAGMTSRLVA